MFTPKAAHKAWQLRIGFLTLVLLLLQRLLLLLRLRCGAAVAAAALFGNNGGRGAGALQRLIAFWHGTGNGFSDAGTLQLCLHLQCA